MWILFLVMCPFGIPLLAGVFMLAVHRRNLFTWLAVLLTWKPLIATWVVLWVGWQVSPTDKGGLSIPVAMAAISPAILITLWLVYVFRDVFSSEAREAVWVLLVLDTVRWGNTFVLLVMGALESGTISMLMCLAFVGLVMPTIFAVVAERLAQRYDDIEFGKKKKKKRGI
jgi:hypothetical protein